MAEKKVNTEKTVVATAGVYDILVRPVVSEKSAKLSESNGVVFEVAPSATKADVARAMQVIYGVKPTKVNIVITKGKVKTFRGRNTGKQRDIKKAYVSLPADATVDLSVESQSK